MEEKIVIKPRIKILIYIFAPLFALILLSNFLAHNPMQSSIFVVLFLSAVLIGLMLFILPQKIIIYKDYFYYYNGKNKITANWSSITQSEIIFFGKWKEPMLKLTIKDEIFYLIRLTLYSKKDSQLFLQNLLTKSSGSIHSENVYNALKNNLFS